MHIDDPMGKTTELPCMLFSTSAVMASTMRREARSGSDAARDARCVRGAARDAR